MSEGNNTSRNIVETLVVNILKLDKNSPNNTDCSQIVQDNYSATSTGLDNDEQYPKLCIFKRKHKITTWIRMTYTAVFEKEQIWRRDVRHRCFAST